MIEDQEKEAPKVFISYSHDSPLHKKWVANLATSLRNNGINVRFDGWDLRRGEDVAKFMEQSLTWADRVLMICTNTYVQKADLSKGGVGYEAMIVTAELIRNLGTAKFIPIIRQENKTDYVPKFVGTRLYVNLSENQNFEDKFEELLRELLDEPAFKKPPIGKNPFSKTPSDNVSPIIVPEQSLPVINLEQTLTISPQSTYQDALKIARLGDTVVWRRIVNRAKASISERLVEWRKNWDKGALTEEEIIPMCLEGIIVYEPLMAIALAGVESRKDAMKRQIGLVDEILSPKNWSRAGLTQIADFPITAAFTYQALHGALCLETDQLDLAMHLAKSRVQMPNHYNRGEPLYQERQLVGWPGSLNGHAVTAWRFLLKLPKTLLWLNDVFTDNESFSTALCSYYLALNILELANIIATQRENILNNRELHFNVPMSVILIPPDQRQRAYALLMRDSAQVRRIWEDLEVSEVKMREYWPKWIQLVAAWIVPVSQYNFWGEIPHKNLFDDLPKKRV